MGSFMKSPSSLQANTLSDPSEECEALLSGVDTPSFSEADASKSSPLSEPSNCSPFGLARIGILLGLSLSILYWLFTPLCLVNNLHFDGQTLRSNGTQEFKRTVLLVSIDGLRHAPQNKHFVSTLLTGRIEQII